MPPINDFKPFATGGGANVESQAAYVADPVVATGFSAGLAESPKLNKAWRQGVFPGAVLMQFVAETLNSDSLDDGDLAGHVTRLRTALAAGATNPVGLSAVINALAFNTAAAPDTKVDISADLAMLRDATGHLTRVVPGAAMTCDTGLAGPAVNGRDQAAAFGNSNWLYLYLIFKPSTSTLATIASLTPPAAFDGTTLPALYTSWAYVEPVYKDAGGLLRRHMLTGDLISYEERALVLNAGSATVETAVPMGAFVPPKARGVLLDVVATRGSANTNNLAGVARLRWKTLKDFRVFDLSQRYASIGESFSALPTAVELPGVQQFLYGWDGAMVGRSLSAWVLGFRVSNGG